MAAAALDLTDAVGGQTSASTGVTTDGLIITGPPGCAALHVRCSHAAEFAAGGDAGDEVPLDADTWTLVWQSSPALPSSPVVRVVPSATASIYVRVV